MVDVRFVFSSKLIQSEQKVSANFKEEILAKVLSDLLNPRLLDYEVSGKMVVLKRFEKAELSVDASKPSHLASKKLEVAEAVKMPIPGFTLSGKITDQRGELLVGASVMLEGTNKGSITDEQGFFSLLLDDSEKMVKLM
ncbi:MAG: hypothetical protein HC817_14830 [Saprospiraceae bacterium]|nr:hypothetical protein [Saprospiraceae bacterium]